MKPFSPALFAGLAACAAIVQQTARVPSGWKALDSLVAAHQQIQFSLALVRQSTTDLDALIGIDKSLLSVDQVRALRAPSADHVSRVLRWLSDNGVTSAAVKDEWITVVTDVGTAESLLNMKLQRFAFEDQPAVLRTMHYSLPDSIRDAVQLVHPVSNFMTPRNRVTQVKPASPFSASSQAAPTPPCRRQVDPACLAQTYNLTHDATQPSDAVIGVGGYLKQYVSAGDVDAFLKSQAPSLAGRTYAVELVNNGTNDERSPGIEADLDMEYVMALAAPASTVFYSAGGMGEQLGQDGRPVPPEQNTNEPYLEFLQYLLAKPDGEGFPHVLSISYGDDEGHVPADYAVKVCEYFGLLAGRGVSVIVASGDGGSAGGGGNCVTSDGRELAGAIFPATCPWVTSVGATTNADEPPVGAAFSGGGFSLNFRRPAWQDGAGLVDEYVAQLGGHLAGRFDARMRAFPDVALVGVDFLTVIGGSQGLVSGTSASTPVFASMIALVVDARLRQGKGPLGCLNPILYSRALRHVYQDVTNGTSMSCSWGGVTPGGWPAARGWDAMTGLGVPRDFNKLLDALVDV